MLRLLLVIFADTDIVELGSGDCSKISILFDVIPPERRRTICYIPVDVSRSAILESAETLSRKYPEISIHGMLADFLKHLKALKDIDVESPHLSSKITIGRGETIHTENSCKFTRQRISDLSDEAGLRLDKVFTDDNQWFSVAHFRK